MNHVFGPVSNAPIHKYTVVTLRHRLWWVRRRSQRLRENAPKFLETVVKERISRVIFFR